MLEHEIEGVARLRDELLDFRDRQALRTVSVDLEDVIHRVHILAAVGSVRGAHLRNGNLTRLRIVLEDEIEFSGGCAAKGRPKDHSVVLRVVREQVGGTRRAFGRHNSLIFKGAGRSARRARYSPNLEGFHGPKRVHDLD